MTTLGKTGLKVSRLGLGLAEIGLELAMADVAEAGQVLNAALDGGINFLDTASCYGISEELIGRTIAHRRDEYILATKCGHVVKDESVRGSWTAQTVTDGIDRSLARMKTDHLDLVQLHSCDVDVLKRGEATEALLKAKEAGKTRFVGYSGDNEAARWAIESGLFDTLQTSFSLVDQHARTKLFALAEAKGMGIIIKRPIANAAWGSHSVPRYGREGSAGEYSQRAEAMARMGPIAGAPDDRILLALAFVFAHPEVDTAIVGTRNPSHMLTNIQQVEEGLSISHEAVEELHRRFDQLEDGWLQQT